MIVLHVEEVGPKHIRIRGIDPLVLDCLHSVPEILEQRDRPAARRRLLPEPTTTDEKANEDWQRLIAPELRHLFVSAGETMVRDLTGVTEDGELTIPAEHREAWMSALNQARLILGEIFSIKDADMTKNDFRAKNQKNQAILRIHLLGYLLHLFVELESGRAGDL